MPTKTTQQFEEEFVLLPATEWRDLVAGQLTQAERDLAQRQLSIPRDAAADAPQVLSLEEARERRDLYKGLYERAQKRVEDAAKG